MIRDEVDALKYAVEAAQQSPCSKAQRGVVIWGMLTRPVMACNGPPPGFDCDGTDACRDACRTLCVHAEMRALLTVGPVGPHTELLHVRTVRGVAVPSGSPRCVDCSKLILDRGIRKVWLLHEIGLTSYSALDFHIESLRNNKLPIIR